MQNKLPDKNNNTSDNEPQGTRKHITERLDVSLYSVEAYRRWLIRVRKAGKRGRNYP